MSIKKELKKVRRRLEGVLYAPMKPTGMIIGTQKGGTTALHHYLTFHPSVVASRQKEIQFFNHDERYERGLDFYHSFFEPCTPARRGRISLDITPDYLPAASVTAARIHAYNPDLRLAAVLRDPVTRAYSAWQMYRKYHQRNPDWFAGWRNAYVLEGYPRGCQPRGANFGVSFLDDVVEEIRALEQGHLLEMSVICQGFYALHLEGFRKYFSDEQLLVMGSEELKADTRGHLYRLEEHLRIPHYQWTDEQLKPYFEGGYQERMSEEARQLLADYYRPHNQALFQLLGREFAWN